VKSITCLNTESRQLPEKSDLKRVCEVSTRLCDVTTPFLYRSVVIKVNERSFNHIGVEPFSVPCPTRRSFLQYTQEVKFVALFHRRTHLRCYHFGTGDPNVRIDYHHTGRHPDHNHARDVERISDMFVLPFLKACKQGNIQSFM
jgi:hypothetical protein